MEINPRQFRAIQKIGGSFLDKDQLEFFRRVWATPSEVYSNRLQALGFRGFNRVLDAGCGIGQWTVNLARLNRSVYAVDQSKPRVHVVRSIMKELDISNVEVQQHAIETLNAPANSFDAIFCYSVLYFTDYQQTLKEFFRLLKPGGKLYCCSNGLGWYLYCIMEQHNASRFYDPRKMAVQSLENTLRYFTTGKRTEGQQLIIPSQSIVRFLSNLGFERIRSGSEGTLKINPQIRIKSFYAPHYGGVENVYEIVAIKGRGKR